MLVKINVTRENINEGICSSPYRCAVAQAALNAGVLVPFDPKRQGPLDAGQGGIDGRFLYRYEMGPNGYTAAVNYPLPENVREWIAAFDKARGSGEYPSTPEQVQAAKDALPTISFEMTVSDLKAATVTKES